MVGASWCTYPTRGAVGTETTLIVCAAMRALLPVLASCFLVVACKGDDPAGPAPAAAAAPAASAARVVARARTAGEAASAAAPASAAASSSAAAASSADAADAPPAGEEWETAKEVVVTGSTALGCETKRVRQWVRVLCAKPNDAGGTPVRVELKKAEVLGPGPGEARIDRKSVKTSSDEGKVSLVARYVEGSDVEAQFSWTDKEKLLVLWWAAGKPEPRQVGGFK